MIDQIIRLVEALCIWLSHRRRSFSENQIAASDDALATDLQTGDPVFIRAKDLAHHTAILGATGCGKTTVILMLLKRDILANHTVCVVDLRGDLIEGVLDLCESLSISASRITLLDLRQRQGPGFNPLSGAGEPYIRALHLLDVLEKEAHSWGVQLEETLRSALLLLAYGHESLAQLEAVFFDASFRKHCLDSVKDSSLIEFWKRFGFLSPEKQQALASPVLNKASSLLAIPALRRILGSNVCLDLRKILDTPGQILLVSLAVDELQRSARMFGSLVVSSISREMMARVNAPEAKRNPVRLVVDEFENLASESFEGLIAEGRRFGLSLILSHQTLSQLSPRLKSVIRNNAGLHLLFQVGFEDAQRLKNELPEGLPTSDLRSLSVGQAVILKRDGSAQVVQFHKPANVGKATKKLRAEVLRQYEKGEEKSIPHPQLDPNSALDLEDWL